MKLVSVTCLLLYGLVANAVPTPLPQLQFGNRNNAGGNLRIDCKTRQGQDGRYRVNCEGVNRDAISLRPSGDGSVVDIEIPNYHILELIKAGFKKTTASGTKVNVLLRKPQQTYDAQVDQQKSSVGAPSVSLSYEPVQKTVVHFPNDRPYSPLQGPILEPFDRTSGVGFIQPRLRV